MTSDNSYHLLLLPNTKASTLSPPYLCCILAAVSSLSSHPLSTTLPKAVAVIALSQTPASLLLPDFQLWHSTKMHLANISNDFFLAASLRHYSTFSLPAKFNKRLQKTDFNCTLAPRFPLSLEACYPFYISPFPIQSHF